MSDNSNLSNARKFDNDEYYTQYLDIAAEIPHYKEYLADKIIYCNCDNPYFSNFYKYFKEHFSQYKLKKLIATCIRQSKKYNAIKAEYNGESERITELNSSGDFRSPICCDILEQSDIVITNPPFSLFREFVLQLVKYNKDFIIVGNLLSVINKDLFGFIKDNTIKLGYTQHNKNMIFVNGDNTYKIKARWFTNFDITQNYSELKMSKKYNADEYPKFDNYNAINVDKMKDIPCDYFDLMGVPVTFLDYYNPKEFEIIDGISRYSLLNEETIKQKQYLSNVSGKSKFFRIIVKRK